ncbi:hypothetical protein TNCV_347421 [Trichonephila clavipes]|nr:hypothetical protein TNCV_347421 [Trichonephila clavipes]
MVWAGISIDGRTNMHTVQKGNLMVAYKIDLYAYKILRSQVKPYTTDITDFFLLMQDNAGYQTARHVDNSLGAETIQPMEWPACYYALNPIDHVWGTLGLILGENILGVVYGLPTTFPFHQPHEGTCDGYLEYPHAMTALYIYKHPCLLRDSNPDPTQTILTAVSVADPVQDGRLGCVVSLALTSFAHDCKFDPRPNQWIFMMEKIDSIHVGMLKVSRVPVWLEISGQN